MVQSSEDISYFSVVLNVLTNLPDLEDIFKLF